MESCDQWEEDQDKTWLDGPVASVKDKLSDDLMMKKKKKTRRGEIVKAPCLVLVIE